MAFNACLMQMLCVIPTHLLEIYSSGSEWLFEQWLAISARRKILTNSTSRNRRETWPFINSLRYVTFSYMLVNALANLRSFGRSLPLSVMPSYKRATKREYRWHLFKGYCLLCLSFSAARKNTTFYCVILIFLLLLLLPLPIELLV